MPASRGFQPNQLLPANAALDKSPARRLILPAKQVFTSIMAVFEIEPLKMCTKLHHLVLKLLLYLNAVRVADDDLPILRTA